MALLNPISIYSQNKSSASTKAENGLQKVTFKTPKGDVNVNLQEEIWAGDKLFGTVESIGCAHGSLLTGKFFHPT